MTSQDVQLSSVWNCLPLDLVFIIIENTDDILTLHRWCIATAKSTLRKAAYTRRWRCALIDLTNLPNNLTLSKKGQRRNLGSTVQQRSLGKALIEADEESGLLPANFLKSIKLRLHEADPGSEERDPVERRLSPSEIRHLIFSVEEVRNGIEQILQCTRNLQFVHHYGSLYQGWLECIVSQTQCTCVSLSLKSEDKVLPVSRPFSGLPSTDRLDWTTLARYENLRHLSIGTVRRSECVSLCVSLSKLQRLDTLELKIVFDSVNYSSPPIPVFSMDGLSGATKCILPSSLTSLTMLLDYGQVGTDTGPSNTPIFQSTKPPRDLALPNMRRMHTNLPRPQSISALLSWFSQPLLRDITLSCMFTCEDSRMAVVNLQAALRLAPIYAQRFTVTGICASNTVSTAIKSDGILDPSFSALSVVVGTRTYAFLNSEAAGPYLSPAPIVLEAEVGAWASIRSLPGIRHLRLEQVELNSIRPEDFDLASFEGLRVLMLYPWTYSAAASKAHGRLPSKRSHEHRVLECVLAAAPMCLRILFVGAYRIWFRREKKGVKESLSPMPLAEAKANDEELEEMRVALTRDDWDFINTVPERPAQDLSPPARKEYNGQWAFVTDHIIRERSFVVFKRVEGTAESRG